MMSDTKICTYKYCIVPLCGNTTFKTPNKVFFLVPYDIEKRKKWCKLIGKDLIGPKSTKYVCEGHFDLERDVENLVRYRLIGGTLHLKKNVLPHKFDCQNKKGHLFNNGNAIKKIKQAKSCPNPQNNDVKILQTEKPMEFVQLNKITQVSEEDTSASQHVDLGDQSDASVFTDQDEPLESLCVSKQTETIANRSSSEVLYCALCLKEITRFRYVCLVCSKQKWCGDCEARGEQHDEHYVLRVPTRRPLGEVDEVVSAIHGALASLPTWKKFFPENAEPAIGAKKKVRTKKKAPEKLTTEKKGRRMNNESTNSVGKESEFIAQTRDSMNKLSKTIEEPTIKKKPPPRKDIRITKRRRNVTSEVIDETNDAMHKSRTIKPRSILRTRQRSKTTKNLPTVDESITTTDVLVNNANEHVDEDSKSLNEARTKKKTLFGKRHRTVENATRNTQSTDEQNETIYEPSTVKQDLTESDKEPEVKMEYLIKDEIDPLREEVLQSIPSVRTPV